MTLALYAGSFDPFTLGHLAVLEDAAAIFARVVVAVGAHPTKRAMLDAEARAGIIRTCADAAGLSDRVEVAFFDGLVVDAARDQGAAVLVRGVRDASDLDDELRMAGMNRAMSPDLPTVLIPPRVELRHVTGTLVRQIAAMGGDVSSFVPAATLAALGARAK